MLVKIEPDGSAYAMAYCFLDVGETLFTERDAMVALSGCEATASTGKQGVLKALQRKVFGQENFFVGAFTAKAHGAWVAVAPPAPGDVEGLYIQPDLPLIVTQGALVAWTQGLDVAARPGGTTTLLLREGISTLRVAAGSDVPEHNVVVVGSYGAIQAFPLQDGQKLVVDSGHLVAWHEGMEMRAGLLGSTVASAASGEGIVSEFTGPGTVWMQTRSEKAFWLHAGSDSKVRGWLFPKNQQNQEPVWNMPGQGTKF